MSARSVALFSASRWSLSCLLCSCSMAECSGAGAACTVWINILLMQVRTFLRLLAERPDNWQLAAGEPAAVVPGGADSGRMPALTVKPAPPPAPAAPDVIRGDVDGLSLHCLPLAIAGTHACAQRRRGIYQPRVQRGSPECVSQRPLFAKTAMSCTARR